MKKLYALMVVGGWLMAMMGGCATKSVKVIGPSVAPVKAQLVAVKRSATQAQGHVAAARKKLVQLAPDPAVTVIDSELVAAQGELVSLQAQATAAETRSDELQGKIDDQTQAYEVLSGEYLKSQKKVADLQPYVWLTWKWRMIAGLELLVFAAYFASRGWLKAQFPFLRFL